MGSEHECHRRLIERDHEAMLRIITLEYRVSMLVMQRNAVLGLLVFCVAVVLLAGRYASMPFVKGQSGNPSGKATDGQYRVRERVCAVCGTAYRSQKLGSRYCSNACKTSSGPWSYPATRHARRPPPGQGGA